MIKELKPLLWFIAFIFLLSVSASVYEKVIDHQRLLHEVSKPAQKNIAPSNQASNKGA